MSIVQRPVTPFNVVAVREAAAEPSRV